MSEATNLYEAPKATLDAQAENPSYEIAGRWRRLGEYLVDLIVLLLVNFAFAFVMKQMYGSHNWFAILGYREGLVFGTALNSTYYFTLDATTNRTPGKMLMGTIVVTEDGAKPHTAQILGRSLARQIPFESLFIFGRKRLCRHDSLSRTKVVRLN